MPIFFLPRLKVVQRKLPEHAHLFWTEFPLEPIISFQRSVYFQTDYGAKCLVKSTVSQPKAIQVRENKLYK